MQGLSGSTLRDIQSGAHPVIKDLVVSFSRTLDTAARQARAGRRPMLAWTATSLPAVDPVGLLADWQAVTGERTLWLRPDEGFALVGAGVAWEMSCASAQRFARVDLAWRGLTHEMVGNLDQWPDLPLAFAGFAFRDESPEGPQWNGYPPARLVLPRLAAVITGPNMRLVVTAVVEDGGPAPPEIVQEVDALLHATRYTGDVPTTGERAGGLLTEELPPPDEWKDVVRAALQAVRRGALQKVVLARGLRVHDGHVQPHRVLQRLRTIYPGCAIFAVARGAQCFLGASPEQLVRLVDGRVSTTAVAGSAPRGLDEEDDRRLGAMLLNSAKDRFEHTLVVEHLRHTLSDVCLEVEVDPSPLLLKVRNIQHLCTALTARASDRMSVIELAGRLHPTPAVGGVPRDEALRWIDRHERLQRGWYAGPVGWVNRRGEGEFAVAIRSALVHGAQAMLFAGCGIVAGSDPDQEYAESWLKLRSMLAALNGPELR